MNKQQSYVIWIGLLLLMAYLFTSSSFKSAIFGKGSAAPAGTNAFLTSMSSGGGSGATLASSAPPSRTGNNHSSTGNNPTAKVVLL